MSDYSEAERQILARILPHVPLTQYKRDVIANAIHEQFIDVWDDIQDLVLRYEDGDVDVKIPTRVMNLRAALPQLFRPGELR